MEYVPQPDEACPCKVYQSLHSLYNMCNIIMLLSFSLQVIVMNYDQSLISS